MPKHGDQWPGARYVHAATIITLLPLVLVVIGGDDAYDGCMDNGCREEKLEKGIMFKGSWTCVGYKSG